MLKEFWDIMPQELVAKCVLVGYSTTRSSYNSEFGYFYKSYQNKYELDFKYLF